MNLTMDALAMVVRDAVNQIAVDAYGQRIHLQATPTWRHVYVNLPLYPVGEHFKHARYGVCVLSFADGSIRTSGADASLVQADISLAAPDFFELLETFLVERVKAVAPTEQHLIEMLERHLRTG